MVSNSNSFGTINEEGVTLTWREAVEQVNSSKMNKHVLYRKLDVNELLVVNVYESRKQWTDLTKIKFSRSNGNSLTLDEIVTELPSNIRESKYFNKKDYVSLNPIHRSLRKLTDSKYSENSIELLSNETLSIKEEDVSIKIPNKGLLLIETLGNETSTGYAVFHLEDISKLIAFSNEMNDKKELDRDFVLIDLDSLECMCTYSMELLDVSKAYLGLAGLTYCKTDLDFTILLGENFSKESSWTNVNVLVKIEGITEIRMKLNDLRKEGNLILVEEEIYIKDHNRNLEVKGLEELTFDITNPKYNRILSEEHFSKYPDINDRFSVKRLEAALLEFNRELITKVIVKASGIREDLIKGFLVRRISW